MVQVPPEAQRISMAKLYDFQLAEDIAKGLARIKVNLRFPEKVEPHRRSDAER